MGEADEINLAALHFVGARVSGQPTNAAPAEFYGDPAKVVMFKRETCAGCKYERRIMAGPATGAWLCQRKDRDGEERKHGKRCGDFRKRGTK
jgi:hypothetical protein